MGLAKGTDTEHGFEAPEAYWRVDEVLTIHNHAGNYHNILLKAYRNKEWYQSGGLEFDRKRVRKWYDPTSQVDFAELYTWIKTLPEFNGAKDA